MSILDDLVRREGSEYINSPDDADKADGSKYGLLVPDLAEYYGRPSSNEELANLTESQARLIMDALYIKKPRFDQIVNQRIFALMVDFGYLEGRPTSIVRLQKILGVKPDGVCGPITLSAINGANPEELYKKILKARFDHIINIALGDFATKKLMAENPKNQLNNLVGWKNRLCEFL